MKYNTFQIIGNHKISLNNYKCLDCGIYINFINIDLYIKCLTPEEKIIKDIIE